MRTVLFIPALKYGLAAGIFIVLFTIFKYLWLFTHAHPDLYLTMVGLFFAASGLVVYHSMREEPSAVIEIMRGEQPVPDFTEELSKRELEVMRLLLTEKSNKEIADGLCIGISTLKTHINHIYHKAGVKNRKELRWKKSAALNNSI